MVSLFSLADRMISVGVKVRPVWLRKQLFSLLFSLYILLRRSKAVLMQIQLPVFLVSGVEQNSGEKIRFLFAGREDFPLFLIDLLFTNQPSVEQVGHIFVWQLNDLKHFSKDIDAILVSCDRFYRRWIANSDTFLFPHMVDMVLDCSPGEDQIIRNISEDAKREIQRVKKKGFSFEITSDVEKVAMFYHDMYMPMVVNRIGKTDMFTPDLLTLRFFIQMGCELMLILLNGSYVCGSFFNHHKDVLEVKYYGTYRGDVDLYKKRVSAADQYFFIRIALDRQVNLLDFGGARPFYNDGLFYYKQKWGTSVKPYPLVPEVFGLHICNDTVMRQFLLKNPFIGLSRKDRFVGYVFVDKDTFTDEMKMQVEKRYKKPGLQEVLFIKV